MKKTEDGSDLTLAAGTYRRYFEAYLGAAQKSRGSFYAGLQWKRKTMIAECQKENWKRSGLT